MALINLCITLFATYFTATHFYNWFSGLIINLPESFYHSLGGMFGPMFSVVIMIGIVWGVTAIITLIVFTVGMVFTMAEVNKK